MTFIVEVQNVCQAQNIPSTTEFTHWLTTLYQGLIKEGEVCIRIVDRVESSDLNQQYRQKSGPTNILSFSSDLSPLPGDIVTPLGDLVICADLVVNQASRQQKPVQAHWCHLTIHGGLHLLGYDHITEADANIMEPMEIACLKQLGFPNPYGVTPIS